MYGQAIVCGDQLIGVPGTKVIAGQTFCGRRPQRDALENRVCERERESEREREREREGGVEACAPMYVRTSSLEWLLVREFDVREGAGHPSCVGARSLAALTAVLTGLRNVN